jgi:hypothetical protein
MKRNPPRCGAKTRRGTPCQAGAIWSTRSHRYTRCKNHGGMSTGPKASVQDFSDRTPDKNLAAVPAVMGKAAGI